MVAGVTTLGAVRTECKQLTDNVNSTFISDAEWNSYIQQSYYELYGLVVDVFGNDYFTQSPSSGYQFTTDGVNEFFALPTDFFKLLGVDLQLNGTGQKISLKPFNMGERNMFQMNAAPNQVPMAGQVITVLYVPRLTVPTVDADTIDGVNGWTDYIVADACIKAANKEETDASIHIMRKNALLARLNSEIENRDAGSPGTIVDSRGRGAGGMRYRLNGNKLWLIGGTSFEPWGGGYDYGRGDWW